MSILVSVVVPTYKRGHLLERCLQALLSQTFPPQAYEIIIVDDGPDDPMTLTVVSEWQQRLQGSYAFVIPPVIRQVAVTGGNQQQVQAEVAYQVDSGQGHAPQIHYLPTRGHCGPATARNMGWRAARGEIIAFTDDDCIPEPDWLSSGVSAFVDDVA